MGPNAPLFRAFPLLIVVLTFALSAHAQNHWPAAFQIAPSVWLNAGDYAGDFRLNAQPNISVNVYWTANGEAVIFSGTLTGGWTNGDTNSVAWEYIYTIKTVQLDPGKAQIVIEWSRRSVTGQIQKGLVPIGRIKQDELEEITNLADDPPENAPAAAHRNMTSSSTLPGGSGSGHWETTTLYYTKGIWDPSTWTYYVIGCSSTVTYWVSDDNGRSDAE